MVTKFKILFLFLINLSFTVKLNACCCSREAVLVKPVVMRPRPKLIVAETGASKDEDQDPRKLAAKIVQVGEMLATEDRRFQAAKLSKRRGGIEKLASSDLSKWQRQNAVTISPSPASLQRSLSA